MSVDEVVRNETSFHGGVEIPGTSGAIGRISEVGCISRPSVPYLSPISNITSGAPKSIQLTAG